jgi:hypothetical protein
MVKPTGLQHARVVQGKAGVMRDEPLRGATSHDGRLALDGELDDLDKNVKFLCGL